MAMTSWTGRCVGGPWDGRVYTQTVTPPTIDGVFNYEGPGGVTGSYSLKGDEKGMTWVWSPEQVSR
jgi:hypothetical protein